MHQDALSWKSVNVAVAAALSLAACSGSGHHARPASPTTTRPRAASTPSTSAAPGARDCRSLNVATLSASSGHALVLDATTSKVQAVPPADRSLQCTFIVAAGGNQAGSVGFSSYPSAQVAQTKLNAGAADARSIGLPVVAVKFGDAAFAVNENGAWFCTILSGQSLGSATAPGTDDRIACAWAQESLSTFG
jgi:hypothetical protein